MKFKNRVKSQLPNNELRQLTIRYFKEHKFTLHTNEKNKLMFKRGSLAQNMITFNPLKWKSFFLVVINNSDVDYECKVDSTFQAVTKQEEIVWETFVANFHSTIENGMISNQETKNALRANNKSIGGYLLYALLGGIILGIPSGFIAYYTGIDSIITIGAASGALGFLYWKIEKEKIN